MKKSLSILLKGSVVVIGWALTPVIGEYLIDYNRQLSPYQLAFFRYFIAAIVLYFILIFQQKVKNSEIIYSLKSKWPKYILVSVMSAFMPVLLFLAVENTSASSASFLLNSNIILIPIFAIIFLKEKMKKNYIIGIVVSTIGLFLVIFDNNLLALADLSLNTIIGNLLAFGSGFFWALYTVFLKKFFADENPILVTFISLLIGSLYLVFFAFVIPPYVTMTLDILGVILVIVIAVLSTSLAYSYWLSLLKVLPTTKTGIIQSFVPMTSVLLSFIFLNESITYIFGIGGVLIICGIIIVEWKVKEQFAEFNNKNQEEPSEKVDVIETK
ncbi:MAG: EamA family transporter [Candidatus Heimdallarchaeota archaeon]|nr:EamA family transporter [Candidatus Heimdallarchaeota archaeon]